MFRLLSLAVCAAWLTVLVAEQRTLNYVDSKACLVVIEGSEIREARENLARLAGMFQSFKVIVYVAWLAANTKDSAILTVHITTWNVNSKNPPEGLKQLLGLADDLSAPDLIVLGLQEVTMDPKQALLDYFFKDKWSLKVEELLSKDYTKVKTKVLVSVALIVYVKSDLADSLQEVEASSVKTGFGGFYGNKGGVMINFRLFGSRFGIVNTHLPANDGEIKARIEDWKTIEAHREKNSWEARDYLFWIGDLNFRIAVDPSLDAEEINARIQKGFYKDVLEKDELNHAREEGLIFKGWNEAEIKFNPTFKVIPGDGSYNMKRRPAWTDRILFKSDTGKEIVNKLYDSVDGFLESDHKPVVAEFELPLELD